MKEKLERILGVSGKTLVKGGLGLLFLLNISCGPEDNNGQNNRQKINKCIPEAKAYCIEINYNQCMDNCLERYKGKAEDDCICNCGNKTADCLEGLGCDEVYVKNYRCYG